jgi:hypothetical protein
MSQGPEDDHIRRIRAALDAQDVPALAAFMA